jgi:hypothetical protein
MEHSQEHDYPDPTTLVGPRTLHSPLWHLPLDTGLQKALVTFTHHPVIIMGQHEDRGPVC